MKVDLSPQAGFPLVLDTSTFEITASSGIRFVQETRRAADMKSVLYQPDALPDETALYWNYRLAQAGEADLSFKKYRLTFGLVLLPPLRIGSEFVKTHGHYHSSMPGSAIGFPEVYTHYFGDLFLFMQRRAFRSTLTLDDCVIYPMKPGYSITIPPGYAHFLVNPSGSPTLMGGLYAMDAIHDYEPVRAMQGGAYYFIEGTDLDRGIPNPRYAAPPRLRKIEDPSGTRFAPPDPCRPLWRSFVEEPLRYTFINDPEIARKLFLPEDQTR